MPVRQLVSLYTLGIAQQTHMYEYLNTAGRTATPPADRSEWRALGPVIEAMGFNFYDAEANMAPRATELVARITSSGIWNAVAFWFELQLDEDTRLNSGPYRNKVKGMHCHAHERA